MIYNKRHLNYFIGIIALTFISYGTYYFLKTINNDKTKFDTQSKVINKEIELNFWTYPRWSGIKGNEANGKVGDWEKYIIEVYEKENPKVKISLQTLDYDGGPQKVNVAIASGMQPDILRDYPGRHQDYAQRGLLLALDKYITDSERQEYLDGVIQQCKGIDGLQYMIPWGITGKFMLINKDLFINAGAENLLPKENNRSWTYEQFKKALKAVSSPEKGIYGCALYAGNEQADNGIVALLENFGVNLIDFNSKNKPFSNINSQKGIEAVDFLRTLLKEGLVAPDADSMKASDCEKMFAVGKIGALIHGSAKSASVIKTYMDQGKVEKFELYPVMYPSVEGVNPHVFGELDTYAVFLSSNEVRQAQAVNFCKFITSKRFINDIKPSLNLPAYKYADDLYPDNEFMLYVKSILPYNKDYYNNIKGFWRIRSILYPAFKEIFALPQKSTKEILDGLEEGINAILNENY